MTYAEVAKAAAALATGRLGWSPDAFWRATPAEMELALTGRLGANERVALGAGDLARLRKELRDD